MKIETLKMKMACVGLTAGLIQFAAQATLITANGGTINNALDVGNPGQSSGTIDYNTYVTSTATTVDFQAVSVGVAPSGLQFGNFYISTGVKNGSPGSTIGFEVENNDVFIPGVSSPIPLVPANGITESITSTGNSTTVDLQIPWSYFLTDPQGLGFDKITAANNEVRFNISQSFSYHSVGDSGGSGINFGADELGTAFYSAVPETSTVVAGALLLLPFGFSAVRRLRKQS